MNDVVLVPAVRQLELLRSGEISVVEAGEGPEVEDAAKVESAVSATSGRSSRGEKCFMSSSLR